MAAFDPATYVPGDAWTETEFLARAVSTPRIVVEAAAETADPEDEPVAGTNMTEPSYFEFRKGGNQNDPYVEISVSGTGTFEVVLERLSLGDTEWRNVDTFTENTEQKLEYTSLYMLRLRVVTGTGIYLALRQVN